MRILLACVWLLLLVAGLAWHYGPGQTYRKLDQAASLLQDAELAVKNQDFVQAVSLFDDALKALPADRVADARKLRLQKAKAQMLARQLPEAHADLQELVEEISADPAAAAPLLAEARSALAQSKYYLTWLMRLEGLGRDAWEPEIEAARQNYRLLAEQARAAGDTAQVKKHEEDLEAAIRLARMDLGELQGLPLPSQ